MGLVGLGEREDVAHLGAQHALLEQLEQPARVGAQAGGAGGQAGHVDRHEVLVVQEQAGGVDLRGVDHAGGAELHEPAARAEEGQAARDRVAREGVDHHVDPVAAGQAPHGRVERLGAVVDRVGHAEGGQAAQLVGVAGGAEHLGPAMQRELHAGQAGRAGGGLHQHPLAGRDPPLLLHAGDRGQAGHEHGGPGGEVERGREREAGGARRDHSGRVAAARDQGEHAVTWREVVHSGADRADHARDLMAGDEPRRAVDGVRARDGEEVDEVDPRRAHLELDLARPRRLERERAREQTAGLDPDPPRALGLGAGARRRRG